MKIKQCLQNIQKGYAEVFYYPQKDEKETFLLNWGYVHIEKIPYKADFEKDIIYYKDRWTIYEYCPGSVIGVIPYQQIGRTTGYATRKEALNAFYDLVCVVWSSIAYTP